ncbi:gas vesicle protein GvpN [Guptibacillus algicola]|uniref:gas vesicle protein GvpN n=1 Tax=Guptibacillus algicola TaxID=225844 RepID=UPI001CD1D22D|nr:gas vesicle protein GvpN [Alkalihalobacillus algicola]MCA0987084.1 gas vesicle protein GvpN [Alkalihalobacillus algicola]
MSVLKQRMKKDNRAFLEDDETKNLIDRSLHYIEAGYPVHFTGPSGAGKTTIALALAKKRKRPVMLMHGNHELDNHDLIGTFTGYSSKTVIDQYVRSVYKKDENVSEAWRDGRLLEAVKHGYTLVYDEFTRSKPSTNNIFLSILEEGILPLYGTKSTEPFIRVHPKFAVIFTSNPAEYAGVYETQDALLDRLITINMNFNDREREARILQQKFDLSTQEAQTISSLVSHIRTLYPNAANGPSIRASLMIARLTEEAEIPIKGDNPEFQRLCLDILVDGLSRILNSDNPIDNAEKLILEACRSLSTQHS